MKIFKKTNDAERPPTKIARRPARPDLNLLLIRLILLVIAAIPMAVYAPLSCATANSAGIFWRAGAFFAVLLFVFSIRKAREWERAIVLRFGKFHKVRGPGFYFLFPLLPVFLSCLL
jgi:lysylphosphatidylglycerol synthetase-like protein (DUF2156 family)